MSNNDFIIKIIAGLNKQLSKRQLKSDLKAFDNSLYVNVITKLSTVLSKRQLKKELKQLNDLYVQIGSNLNIDKKTKHKLEKQIKDLQNSISNIEIQAKLNKTKLNAEIDSARKAAKTIAHNAPVSLDLEIKKNKAISDIEYIAKKYSKLFSNISAKQKYNTLLTSAYSISDNNQLRSVRAQISAFTSELRANDLASKSLGDQWKHLIDRCKNLCSAASIVTTIFTQVRQSITTFLELDTAMTNLYKVQDDITSRDQFSTLLTKWNQLAQDLSVTTTSLINSASEWSKIGFNMNMSEQLAQITAIFEQTAEISNEKANSTLISIAQAFPNIDDLGEDDYVARVESIGDKINKVGNEFAIDSEGVSDALQNSSAALRMANNDLNESIAIVTTANKIFQNPDEVGNMSKVLSARLRGQKGELEDLGEDTDGMIESVSKIQTQILNLTHNKVNIFENDNETLKSTYNIMLEIGKVFQTLSDKDQAELLEIIAGKQRMSAVASLLLNYQELEKVKEASMNSDNSMQQEYNKYLDSAEAHIISFQEKLTEAYSSFMSGDLITYTADIGSGILDLVNSTDLLKHSLITIAAIKLGEGITTLGGAIGNVVKQMNTLGGAIQQVGNLPLDAVLRKSALDEIGESTKNLTEKNLKYLLSKKQLTDEDKVAILIKHGLTEEEAIAKLTKMNLTSVTEANTVANTANASSVNTLKGTLVGLKSSIKATWAAMSGLEKASIIFAAASTAWSILSSVIDGHNQNIENAKQKTQELADEVIQEEDNLVSLINQYNELDKTDRSTDNTKKIKLLNEDINKVLGVQAEHIDLVNGKLDEQSNKLKRNLLQKLEDDKPKLDTAVSVTKSEYEKGLEQGAFGIDPWGNVSRALTANGAVTLDDTMFNNISDVLSNMDAAEQIKQLKEWLDLLTKADASTGKYGNQLSMLQGWYDGLSEKQTKYIDTLDKQRKNEEQQKIINDSLNGKINSKKAFKDYRSQIKETFKDDSVLQNQMLDFVDIVFPLYADKLEETAKKAEKASKEKTPSHISFAKAWENLQSVGEDAKDVTPELLELARAGEISDATLMSNENYITLLTKTGLSAREARYDIMSMISEQERLSGFQSQMDNIATLYNEFKEKGFVTAETLEGLPDVFKQMNRGKDFDLFSQIVGDPTSGKEKIKDAFDDIVTAYIQDQDILLGTTNKNRDAVIANLKDAGVTNAKQVVDSYIDSMNLIDAAEDEFYNESAKQRSTDISNFQTALKDKNTSFSDACDVLGKNNAALINSMGKQYADDYVNWLELLDKKKRAYNAFVKAYNKATDINDDSSIYQQTQKGSNGASDYSIATGVNEKKRQAEEAAKEEKKGKKQLAKYKTIDLDLDTASFTPKNTDNKPKKEKSDKTKSKETIDWISRYLEVLQSQIDLTKAKFENLFHFKSKQNNLDKQITQTTKLLNAQSKAAEKYQKKANRVKLSSSLKKKVQNGDITGNLSELIATYGEKTANKISKYQEYIDKTKDAKKATQETLSSIIELNEQKLDNITSWYDTFVSKIESVQSKIQSTIDLTSKIRGLLGKSETGSTTSYENLLNSQSNEISKLQTERAKTAKQYKQTISNVAKIMKNAGASKKDIKAYKEQAKAQKNTALNGYAQQINQLYSDMLETASALSGIPLEKAAANVDRLSNEMTKISSKMNLTSGYIDRLGENLEYANSLYEEENRNKVKQLGTYTNAKKEAQNQVNTYYDELAAYGIDPKAINNGSSLKELEEKYGKEAVEVATKYLASVETLDTATKNEADAFNDFIETVQDNSKKMAQAVSDFYEDIRQKINTNRQINENQLDIAASLQEKLDLLDRDTSLQQEDTASYQNEVLQNAGNANKEIITLFQKYFDPRTVNPEGDGNDPESGLVRKDADLYPILSKFAETFRVDEWGNIQVTEPISDSDFNTIVDLINQVKGSGWLSEDDILTLTNALTRANSYLANQAEAQQNYAVSVSEEPSIIQENFVKKFNAYETEFSRIIDHYEDSLNDLNDKISLATARGQYITSRFYKNIKSMQEQELNQKEKQKQQLQKLLDDGITSGRIKKGSDDWYDLVRQIQECADAADELTISIAETAKSMREAERNLHDRSIQEMDRLNREAEYYQNVISRKDAFDDNGNITANGTSRLALSAGKISTNIAAIKEQEKEMAQLRKQISYHSPDSEEGMESLIDRYEELQDSVYDYIQACYDENDAIGELVEQGLNAQLDALNKIIEKYKATLQEAQSLRDYNNTVEEQTENIASLQKQLKVADGDISEEGRARAESLRVQLQDAQKALEDTEYDKYIQDQESMLDQFSEDYQNFIEQQLDQLDQLISQVIDALRGNTDSVVDAIKAIDTSWGTELSDSLQSMLKQGDYSTTEDGVNSNSHAEIQADKVYVNTTKSLEDDVLTDVDDFSAARAKISSSGTTDHGLHREQIEGIKDAMIEGLTLVASGDTTFDKFFKSNFGAYLTTDAIDILKRIVNASSTNELIGKLRTQAGFADGGIAELKPIGEDGLAWIRNGEGLVSPDDVPAIKKLLDAVPVVNNMMDNLVPLKNMPIPVNHQQTSSVTIGDIHPTFVVQNATNADALMKEIQHNDRFNHFCEDFVYGVQTGNVNRIMKY